MIIIFLCLVMSRVSNHHFGASPLLVLAHTSSIATDDRHLTSVARCVRSRGCCLTCPIHHGNTARNIDQNDVVKRMAKKNHPWLGMAYTTYKNCELGMVCYCYTHIGALMFSGSDLGISTAPNSKKRLLVRVPLVFSETKIHQIWQMWQLWFTNMTTLKKTIGSGDLKLCRLVTSHIPPKEYMFLFLVFSGFNRVMPNEQQRNR